jgi:hypothetical protein
VSDNSRNSIGPHEGRELDLMIAGSKPLSMFVEPVPSDGCYFPEQDFDALVSEGRLIKADVIETWRDYTAGRDLQMRRVLYALLGEEWRIEAMTMVQDAYRALGPGWKLDLERIIGSLLGYNREDVEFFISTKLR